MKSLSSWYSAWPSSGTGSVSRIFSVSRLQSAHETEDTGKHVITFECGLMHAATCERVSTEGGGGGEAGGGVSQQIGERGGDGGKRRFPSPFQHLWKLVLTERRRFRDTAL